MALPSIILRRYLYAFYAAILDWGMTEIFILSAFWFVFYDHQNGVSPWYVTFTRLIQKNPIPEWRVDGGETLEYVKKYVGLHQKPASKRDWRILFLSMSRLCWLLGGGG